MINRAGSAPLALKWGGNRWEEKIVSDEDACLEGFLVGLWCRSGKDWMQAASDQTKRLQSSMILSLLVITQPAVPFQILRVGLQTMTHSQDSASCWTAGEAQSVVPSQQQNCTRENHELQDHLTDLRAEEKPTLKRVFGKRDKLNRPKI
jgi:hypothetical protein